MYDLSIGLGCACQNTGIGSLNTDTISIGGKLYTAGQIVDKTIVANRDVTLYPSLFKDDGKFTVKAGQPIGKVFSYLRPDNKSNPTGRVALMFERGYNQFFWLKDDKAVNTNVLKQQGVQTLKQEVEQKQKEEEKRNSPLEYYIKEYGTKVLIGVGVAWLVVTVTKEFVKAKVSAPAQAQPQNA
ncbi:MAG: hypothetical protein ACK5OS_01915 [Chryseotalea sp.]